MLVPLAVQVDPLFRLVEQEVWEFGRWGTPRDAVACPIAFASQHARYDCLSREKPEALEISLAGAIVSNEFALAHAKFGR